MPEVRGVVLPVVPVLRLSAAQAQGEAVTREERLAEWHEFIMDYVPGLDDSDANANLRDYALALVVECRHLSAERDELRKVIEDVLYLGDCHCDEAYTGRGRHQPNANCGAMDEARAALSQGDQVSPSWPAEVGKDKKDRVEKGRFKDGETLMPCPCCGVLCSSSAPNCDRCENENEDHYDEP